MFSPRWQKMLRDIWVTRGRLSMMAAAIGMSLIGLGTVLGAYSVLTREISRNYLGTLPATATLEMEQVNEELVSAARAQAGIASAEARASVLVRMQLKNGDWRPLLLFVVKDFNRMQLSTFRPNHGAWPPPVGTMLLERTVLPLFKLTEGDVLQVKAPHGLRRGLRLAGTVHDPGLAPAWQERMGYGYITPETLAWLGESGTPDELKIRLEDPITGKLSVASRVLAFAEWLQQQGHRVREIQIPPAGKHPHQGQMTAIIVLLLVFSLLGMGLSGILVATMVSGLMAREVRQIGVMKAVGAGTHQIIGMYFALMCAISAAALALGIPLGMAAGNVFAHAVANMLNFTLYSQRIPGWVFVVQVIAGLVVPLVFALIPILKAGRMTVREAMSDFGVREEALKPRRLVMPASWLAWLDRTLLLAIRNTFRRQGRLLLTLGLLAAGGAMFMTALNVKSAWNQNLSAAFAAIHYDFEIRLNQAESIEIVSRKISQIKGVRKAEAWGYVLASRTQPGGIEVTHIYPDGGHGSFSIKGVPPATRLVTFPVLAGRWLIAQDTDAVVLNPTARLQFPQVKIGDVISLTVNNRATAWHVVGFIREIGPAAAYVNEKTFEARLARPGYAQSFRIAAPDHDPQERKRVIREIEQALTDANISVAVVIADSEYRNAITDHIYILIFALGFMAALMGMVGMLGLTSTTSTNIVERTREFGVMRAIGATPGIVLRNIVAEAVLTGVLSLCGAGIISLPLSHAVGAVLGTLAFKTPLPLVVSGPGVWFWLGIVLVGSVIASAYPAWRASQLTIRETLVYE